MLARKWKKTRYSTYRITLHLVFVVKYRKKIFTKKFIEYLEGIFRETCDKLNCPLLEFGGESDHVHLLVSLCPKIPIYRLVGRLKGSSSYEIRRKFSKEMEGKLWGKHLWSPSYCVVSCGGASLDVVKAYIQNQGRA